VNELQIGVKKRHQEKDHLLDKIHICAPVAKLLRKNKNQKKKIFKNIFFFTPLSI